VAARGGSPTSRRKWSSRSLIAARWAARWRRRDLSEPQKYRIVSINTLHRSDMTREC
jgi:hypothetical protein